MSIIKRHLSMDVLTSWYNEGGMKYVKHLLDKSDVFVMRNDFEGILEKFCDAYYDKNLQLMEVLINEANIYNK